jgi:hypothetical protein
MPSLRTIRPPHRRRTQFASRLRALGAVIALGATALTLNGATQAIEVAQARPPMPFVAVRAAPADSVHGPATDRIRCLNTPRRIAGPSLTTVLFPLTPEERGRVLRIILMTPCHLRATYSPVK